MLPLIHVSFALTVAIPDAHPQQYAPPLPSSNPRPCNQHKCKSPCRAMRAQGVAGNEKNKRTPEGGSQQLSGTYLGEVDFAHAKLLPPLVQNLLPPSLRQPLQLVSFRPHKEHLLGVPVRAEERKGWTSNSIAAVRNRRTGDGGLDPRALPFPSRCILLCCAAVSLACYPPTLGALRTHGLAGRKGQGQNGSRSKPDTALI